MICPGEQSPLPTEAELRFAVVTRSSGRVELRCFQHPRDLEGVALRLTPRERDELAIALTTPGFHAIGRDDAPDLQLDLFHQPNHRP